MAHEYNNAVFAGGGSRCFWQLGFWDGANRGGLELSRTVRYAASTSAGCAIAVGAMLNRGPEALELFKSMTSRNPRNIHWHNLLPGNSGAVLPHVAMYREALESFLSPADLELLADKDLEFLMSIAPGFLPGALGPLAAFPVYGLEKHLTGAVHSSWTQKIGFTPLVRGNRDVKEVAELVDIILGASCVPPVLPSRGVAGMPVLDGGLIDSVPASLAEGRAGKTLILLSKRYRKPLPVIKDRVYVQPSEPIRIDKFDYANPAGLQQAYDLGVGDGNRFAAEECPQAL